MKINQVHCPACGSYSLHHFLDCIDHSVSRESFRLIQCKNCDLLLTDPQPDAAGIQRYYQFEDYVSHTSNATNLINSIYLFARKYTLKQKLNLINNYSDKGKLLDMGCGTGNFLDVCIRNGWWAGGIESSENARKIAMKTVRNISGSLQDHIGQDYDVITLWHVLEHLKNFSASLDILKKLLKTSGTIFIAVPNYQSYDARHYKEYWAGYDVPRHLWHFSKKTMENILRKHQFKLVDIRPMKLDAYYVSLLSEKYRRKKITPVGLLNALKTGLASNLSARKTINYSSLIYIVRK